MISYAEALALITRAATKPKSKTLPLVEALGKIAANEITSTIQVPIFRNSAMDGFAVCATQLAKASEQNPVTLPIQAAIAAGDKAVTSDAGQSVQIMTGAIVPEPYDAIVPVELVKMQDGSVTFTRLARVGDHIRLPAEDVREGQIVLKRGETITPEIVMLLSALGITLINVNSLPRLHILSTGNEITDDYQTPLQGSQIYNSNAPYLMASATVCGLSAVYEGIIRDDATLFEKKILSLKEPAIILSTGAVSKGVWDFIPDRLKNMGAQIHFHRVNIRPGKPILFATLPNGSFFFGLPGNPISSAIGFTFFVMPLVRALQGLTPAQPLMATLDEGFTKKGNFRHFLKSNVYADASGNLRVRIADGQESFKISPMAANNAWAVLEEEKMQWQTGETVPVALYGTIKTHITTEGSNLCQAA